MPDLACNAGVVNMNTGDAAGDTYFALYEMVSERRTARLCGCRLSPTATAPLLPPTCPPCIAARDALFVLLLQIFPLYCRQMPGDGSCDGSSQKTLNNYNFDV